MFRLTVCKLVGPHLKHSNKNAKHTLLLIFYLKLLVISYSTYIHKSIGSICSFSNAFSIVGIKYLKSATNERGLVIGLSCLNGTKK